MTSLSKARPLRIAGLALGAVAVAGAAIVITASASGMSFNLRPSGPAQQGDAAVTANGASSAAIGAAGGNVGLLDGSVQWRGIRQMQTYRGSQQWGDAGCWAMW